MILTYAIGFRDAVVCSRIANFGPIDAAFLSTELSAIESADGHGKQSVVCLLCLCGLVHFCIKKFDLYSYHCLQIYPVYIVFVFLSLLCNRQISHRRSHPDNPL